MKLPSGHLRKAKCPLHAKNSFFNPTDVHFSTNSLLLIPGYWFKNGPLKIRNIKSALKINNYNHVKKTIMSGLYVP